MCGYFSFGVDFIRKLLQPRSHSACPAVCMTYTFPPDDAEGRTRITPRWVEEDLSARLIKIAEGKLPSRRSIAAGKRLAKLCISAYPNLSAVQLQIGEALIGCHRLDSPNKGQFMQD